MDISQFPQELTNPALQLVFLMGLDVNNNPAHKTVCDMFTKGWRSDPLPLNFRILTEVHDLQNTKTQANDASENAEGILKVNWMEKHLSSIPAVVVLFVDLDWQHPSWNEKILECRSKVDSIREGIGSRTSVLALVLIQSVPPIPSDNIAAQRATELCSACQLSPQRLFVLPQTDRLFGFILRLKHAFCELAQTYYQGQVKRIKAKKESTSRNTSELLYIRYSFKQGFFYELQQDFHAALRCYKMAYQHLIDAKLIETNAFETKCIAGFLTYKICRLAFQQSTPRDAVAHFRAHADYFANRIGPTDFAVTHFAWLSGQFAAFAELFEAAVQKGVVPIQNLHPGYYYHTSADYSMKRRKLVSKMFVQRSNFEGKTPMYQWLPSDFYGQIRPVAIIDGSVTAADIQGIQLQDDLLLATMRHEMSVNHAAVILSLLTCALTQFKKYRCVRMKLIVMNEMADTYFSIGSYDMALQLLDQPMWDYRRGSWWLLMRICLVVILKCAYVLGKWKTYVIACLEALNPRLGLTASERARVSANFQKFLDGTVPDPEPELNQNDVDNARTIWNSIIADRCFFLVPMHSVRSCIDLKVGFKSATVEAGAMTGVSISLTSNAVQPMGFSRLALLFSNATHDPGFVIDNASFLILNPGETKNIDFAFSPLPEDVDHEIFMTSLKLGVGQPEASTCGTLQWDLDADDTAAITEKRSKPVLLIGPSKPTRLRVLSRTAKARLNTDNDLVAYFGEVFPVTVYFENMEADLVNNVKLNISVEQVGKSHAYERSLLGQTYDIIDSREVITSLGSVASGSRVSHVIFFRSDDAVESITLRMQVCYDIELLVAGKHLVFASTSRCTASVRLLPPFSVESFLLSERGEQVQELVAGQDFVLSVNLKFDNAELYVDDVSAELDDGFQLEQVSKYSLEKITVERCSNYCLCFAGVPTMVSEAKSIGLLTVTWKRSADCDYGFTKTRCPLAEASVVACPVLVSCSVPAFGFIRTPFQLTYTIKNMANDIADLHLKVEPSEMIMFSGLLQDNIRLLPNETSTLSLVLLPLAVGQIEIPRLMLSSAAYTEETLNWTGQRNVLRKILILPCCKEMADKTIMATTEAQDPFSTES